MNATDASTYHAADSGSLVGLEVRRNTVATKAATLQDSVGYDVGILIAAGATPESASALWDYSFNLDRVSGERLIQGRWLFASTVRHWENIYLQHLAGTLSEDASRAREPALRVLVLSPGWDDYINCELGAFMGGPVMQFAQDVRAAARAMNPAES